ncbi:MAG: 5'/3'-nucleotidase SurE [Pseudomonadota bacterium]
MEDETVRIVVTNDDGIDAPGLAVLEGIAAALGDVVVVAPESAQSGVGHRVTTGVAIAVTQIAPKRFSVSGTPADCVRLAIKSLAATVDWLIAGINPGANLGSDIYNSGTVAAAREAAILGVPALAISQYISKGGRIDWQATGHHAGPVVTALMRMPLPKGAYWNVNLPHPLSPGQHVAFRICDPDPNPHAYGYLPAEGGYRYSGTIHERPRVAGMDVAVCFNDQRIAVSQLHL